MGLDNSYRRNRRALVLVFALALCVLIASVGLLLTPATETQAASAPAAIAPASSDWTNYIEGRTKVAPRTIDGRPLGAMPSPLNAALTRGLAIPGVVGATPSSYDLRTLGRVTSVKNQGSLGPCWSFATYGSFESYLMPGENRDFAEDNLVLRSGYGTTSSTASDLYNMGGNYLMSTAYLARWEGPVNESSDAYGDSFTPGGLSPTNHVQQVDWIPARASATDNANVKTAVMDLGAVYVSMYFTGSSSGSSYYRASTAAYYFNGTTTSGNHAVLIVGWDDNYSASNFATRPAGNGAFLVRNSWGTSWGNAGYFWVSYYDTCFGRTDDLAAFDNAEATTNYSGVYQYDQLGCTTQMYYGSSSGGVGWFGNVFTATSTDTVTAVSFYTLYPGTSYEIYTGASLAGKTLNTTGTMNYMGYHTVTLSSPLSITQGEKFAVAVKVVTPSTVTDANKYPVAIEYPFSGYSEKATASSGQSYISTSGTSWVDITSIYSNTNVCVKAFTLGSGGSTPTSYSLTTNIGTGSGTITRNPDQATYASGTQVTLTANADTGYVFTGWSNGATGSTNPITITMDANKTVTANFEATGPAATRYEQDNAYLVYTGRWTTSTSTAYSGRSYKTTNTAGANVTACFTGTAVSYIARMSSSLGIAKVTLDGEVSYVDLYSRTTKYQQVAWTRSGLQDGPHTLVIERNGTRNPSSSGYSINLDALDIVGTLTSLSATSYSLTTNVGTGSGTITRSPDQAAYTSGAQVTLTANPTTGYVFTGWSNGATGDANPVTITMDANKTVTANFQESSSVTYTLTTTVASGSGTITRNPDQAAYAVGTSVTLTPVPADGYVFVGWGGAASGNASPLAVNMTSDKTITATFALAGSTETRYEQNNPLLLYAGRWSTVSNSSFSGGSFIYTNYAGAKVTISFTGTSVKYIARVGSNYGRARVTLDGVSYTVDLYNSFSAYKRVVWSASDLSFGTHTLTIEYTGTRNSRSTANTVNLDALDIAGALVAP